MQHDEHVVIISRYKHDKCTQQEITS